SDLPTAARGSYRAARTRPARTGHPHRSPPQPAAPHRREPPLPPVRTRLPRPRSRVASRAPRLRWRGPAQPEPSMQQPDQSEARAPTPRKRSSAQADQTAPLGLHDGNSTRTPVVPVDSCQAQHRFFHPCQKAVGLKIVHRAPVITERDEAKSIADSTGCENTGLSGHHQGKGHERAYRTNICHSELSADHILRCKPTFAGALDQTSNSG